MVYVFIHGMLHFPGKFPQNIFFQCKSWVADADMTGGAKCATPMLTTVGIITWIGRQNAVVPNAVVTLVADT